MAKLKYRGTHRTLIPFAREVAMVLRSLGEIAPGEIFSGASKRCVKIKKEIGWIKLTVKQGSTVQELRIYGEQKDLMLLVARKLRDNNIPISFHK